MIGVVSASALFVTLNRHLLVRVAEPGGYHLAKQIHRASQPAKERRPDQPDIEIEPALLKREELTWKSVAGAVLTVTGVTIVATGTG